MLQYTILDTLKHPFVIYKDIFANQYCLDPRKGMNTYKSMVIALPRAGVHLMQEILQELNLFHVRVTHEKNVLNDYRFLSDQDRKQLSRLHDTYSLPITDSYKWIVSGQFVHNKMRYDENTYFMLRDSDYSVYLLKRDLRSCVVSHARQKHRDICCFTDDPNKLMDMYITSPYYKEILEQCKLMIPWFDKKTFDVLEYETLIGQKGQQEQVRMLQTIIEDFRVRYVTPQELIHKCINVPTFSFSGCVSDYQKYWNTKVDKWFNDVGFTKLNNILGYV